MAPTHANVRHIVDNRGEVVLDHVPGMREERCMPRKLMMVVALVVVMVPSFGAAALAAGQLIQCKSIPCDGSGQDDKILERIGIGKNDRIIASGGHDLILANKYDQEIDVIRGGLGSDKINVADGDISDTAGGGAGRHDWCIVDVRSELGRGCEKVTVR